MKGTGAVLIMLAAVCWGLSGVIAGYLMSDGWNAFTLSFYRGAVGLCIVLVWLTVRPGRSGLGSGLLWLWSVIAGLGIAGNFAFYFLSIETGSVAVAVTLMYCAPVFVYLASFTLKLERPTPLKLGAIGVAILGVVLLTRAYDIGSGEISALNMGAGLLSGVSYAVFIFGFKNAAPHGSPQAILVIAFAVLVVLLFWPAKNGQMLAALHSPEWPLFVILGIIGAGFSFFIYIVGLHHTTPTVASVVAMLEPVVASFSGFLILQEILSGQQVLGMVLILTTATALGFHSNADKESA